MLETTVYKTLVESAQNKVLENHEDPSQLALLNSNIGRKLIID